MQRHINNNTQGKGRRRVWKPLSCIAPLTNPTIHHQSSHVDKTSSHTIPSESISQSAGGTLVTRPWTERSRTEVPGPAVSTAARTRRQWEGWQKEGAGSMAAGRPRSGARSTAEVGFRACQQKELSDWYTQCRGGNLHKKIIFIQFTYN